jgi:hypothetical protein
MLTINNFVVPLFFFKCQNCHVVDGINYLMGNVHCNACSKSKVKKLSFLCDSITANNKSMLTIEGKWLEGIVHMIKFAFLNFLHPKKIQIYFIQFAFKENFDYHPHMPLLVFRKTFNNLSCK